MASGFCSESQTGAASGIRPPPHPPSCGTPGQAGTLLLAGHPLRHGQLCPGSFLSAHMGSGISGQPSSFPLTNSQGWRGSLRAFSRATSQSSALLVRQGSQGLLLIPLQEQMSCLHSMSPIRVGELLALDFIGSVSSGVWRSISLSNVFFKIFPKRLVGLEKKNTKP